jgi:hypothetical protein
MWSVPAHLTDWRVVPFGSVLSSYLSIFYIRPVIDMCLLLIPTRICGQPIPQAYPQADRVLAILYNQQLPQHHVSRT